MQGIKERLLQFVKFKEIGQGKFEKITGLANGLINNIGDNLSSKTINKITVCYPELNLQWLLNGIGEMINKSVKKNQLDKEQKENKSPVITEDDIPLEKQGNESIYDLIESNRKLIETQYNYSEAQKKFANAQQIFAESHKSVVDTNSILAVMLKNKNEQPPSSVDAEVYEVGLARLNILQNLLIDIGVGKLWQTKAEGEDLLRKEFSLIAQKVSKSHKMSESDMIYK